MIPGSRRYSWRRDRLPTPVFLGFPCGSAGKDSTCNEGDVGLIPGLRRFPGEGKGYPLQYSGLENSMDCIIYGVSKSWTRLSDRHFQLLNHTLFKSLWLIFGELMFNFRAYIYQYQYGARVHCCCLVVSHI